MLDAMAIFLAVLGFFCALTFVFSKWSALWPTVLGRLTDVERILWHQELTTGKAHERALISYEYIINKKKYQSARVSAGIRMVSIGDIEKIISDKSVGDEVVVYYLPFFPSYSLICPNYPTQILSFYLSVAMFFAAGALWAIGHFLM